MPASETPIPAIGKSSRDSRQQPTSNGISVILFEDPTHHGRRISELRSFFQKESRPCEFIVVAPESPKLTPLSATQHTSTANGLDEAICRAKHQQIAIVDSIYRFDSSHWSLLNELPNDNSIRTWSYKATQAPRSRKILVTVYCLVILWLLRVRKNRISPGMVLFKRSTINDLSLTRLRNQSVDSVTQLLALAKASGVELHQNLTTASQSDTVWLKSSSRCPHFPNSKSLKRSIKSNIQFWFSELAFPFSREKAARGEGLQTELPRPLFALLFLVAAILLFGNSNYPLFEPDEARNAQLAINLLESGNWSSLTLAGEAYWDKPPLLAWMTAISYRCLGISEFATRLPGILASMALLTFVMFAGAKLVGRNMAMLGAVSLLLAWGFLFQSRYVTMDVLLTLFTTATTFGVALGTTEFRVLNRGWLIVAGLSLGLGILAKGPVCVVITAPPILLWLYLRKDVSDRMCWSTIGLVTLPAAIVSLPWFVIATLENPEFLSHFLWKHHVVRFSNAFNHQEPFWYYMPIVWLFMFPVSILMPRAFHLVFSSKQKYRQNRTPFHGLLAMSAVWILFFFSLSQCKLPAYILPVFPIIALLIGHVLNHELGRSTAKRTPFDRLPTRITIGMSVLSTILVVATVYQFQGSTWSLLALSLIAPSVVLLSRKVSSERPRQIRGWIATASVCVIFVTLGVNHLVPAISHSRSILQGLRQESGIRSSMPVIYFGRDSFAASMYLPDRQVEHIREESLGKMRFAVQRYQRVTIVASDENMDRVRQAFGNQIHVERGNSRHTFHIDVSPPLSRIADRKSKLQTR